MEKASLYSTLAAETSILKRRHQRKGVEYRVRDTGVRPSVDPESLAAFEGTMSGGLASLKSSPTKQNNQLPEMDAYDPQSAAQAEHDELMVEVTKRREEASALHHTITILSSRKEDLEHESEKLAYEDDIERARREGKKAVEEGKAKAGVLEEQIQESESYRQTLEYMYRRHREERVECIALQKVFEQSLTAHKREFELKQQLLQDVRLSKDEVVGALQALQKDIATQMSDLDKKMEGKKLEIILQQEKARLRATKMEQDFLLQSSTSASLPVGPIEERLLAAKVKDLAHSATDLRNDKLRAVAEADHLEESYNKLRIAAGLEALKQGLATKTKAKNAPSGDSFDFLPPRSDDILDRFRMLEDEMRQMDTDVSEYSTRLWALKQRHAQLLIAKQPSARDAKDEADTDISRINSLTRRQETARRAAETAREELTEATNLRIQLLQSVDQLARRVEDVPLPSAEFAEPVSSCELDDDAVLQRLLDKDARNLPTEWSRELHSKLRGVIGHLKEIFRMLHPTEACDSMQTARSWMESRAENNNPRASMFRSLSRAASPDGREHYRSMSIAMPPNLVEHEMPNKLSIIGGEEEVEAAIEQLVLSNPYTIRIPSPATVADAPAAKTAKVISEAISTFEKQLREGIANNLKETGTSLGRDRRGSASMGRTSTRRPDTDETRKSGEPEQPQFLRRVSIVGQATAVLKPKPRELQKMLAAAMQMSGAEVDEALAGQPKEVEEVLSRDSIKRATVTQLRQAAKAKAKQAQIAAAKS